MWCDSLDAWTNTLETKGIAGEPSLTSQRLAQWGMGAWMDARIAQGLAGVQWLRLAKRAEVVRGSRGNRATRAWARVGWFEKAASTP